MKHHFTVLLGGEKPRWPDHLAHTDADGKLAYLLRNGSLCDLPRLEEKRLLKAGVHSLRLLAAVWAYPGTGREERFHRFLDKCRISKQPELRSILERYAGDMAEMLFNNH